MEIYDQNFWNIIYYNYTEDYLVALRLWADEQAYLCGLQ